MITKEEKQEFRRYRAVIGFQKFPRFVKWMRNKFPGKDLHHIAGSTFGRKFTDALMVPLDHEFHLSYVEKEKAKYFCLYLRTAFSYFLEWAKEELGEDLMSTMDGDLFPELVKKIIDSIFDLEYKKCSKEIIV